MANEVLDIHNLQFVVTSQIDRALHWTMIRELTMNAIEAASQAYGEKIVHWTTGRYEGVRKAVIWNTGPGMRAAELKAATKIACEVNKNLGLDENFGVGAKVSSLANNRVGMRFRSCKDQRVSQVLLGYDQEQKLYVRFEFQLPDGRKDTVIDVTGIAIKEGREVSQDWTEVMLLGNSEDQDTVDRPLATQPTTEKAFVANSIYRRFYRLPPDVKLKLDEPYHRLGGTRALVPIGQRFHKFARAETVSIPEFNMNLHFLHDPPDADKNKRNLTSRGALSSTATTCCLVHKDEMYSVMFKNQWSAAAPHFGIPFGSKELCVHIELDDEEARPTQYRERLISKQTGEDIVPLDFAFCVRERMPEWVKDVIRSASPRKTEDLSDLRRELQELLNRYRIKVPGRKLDPEDGQPSAEKQGEDFGGFGATGGAQPPVDTLPRGFKRRRLHEAPEGATATSLYEVFEKAPNPIILDDPEEIEGKGLKGRAALFIHETGDLFVNGLYEAVDRTINDVEPEFVDQAEPETIKRITTSEARRAMAFRVGKATVFALAKRANDDWTQVDMQAALTKKSLSIAADNYEESLSLVKRSIRDSIKLERAAA